MLVITVLVVEIQQYFLMSLVMDTSNVRMTCVVFISSTVFVVGFVQFSSKSSPVYKEHGL